MCTVSWMRQDGGYRLFCNRDEKHTRRIALPPAARERRGVRFIAPLDGDYGGAWIGVNQFGLSLISSSRDLAGVSLNRRRLFNSLLMESGKVDDHLLNRFHNSHFPAASAYSTCMHRDDARTVSFSKVNVSRDSIEFFYQADSPCAGSQANNIFEIVMAREAV